MGDLQARERTVEPCRIPRLVNPIRTWAGWPSSSIAAAPFASAVRLAQFVLFGVGRRI
jgi:hypothetical protein